MAIDPAIKRLLLVRIRAGAVVLVVADVLTPVSRDVLVVDFVEGKVDHQPARGSSVPVLLVRLDVDAVAWVNDNDGPAAALT